MSLSIYDVTVPAMLQGIAVMDDYLDHAQKLERSKSLDPGSVLTARLAPDMLTFGEQFAVNCEKVALHLGSPRRAKIARGQGSKPGSSCGCCLTGISARWK